MLMFTAGEMVSVIKTPGVFTGGNQCVSVRTCGLKGF